MPPNKFDIVVACDKDLGIGRAQNLPWRLSQDMRYFRDLTKQRALGLPENTVIMGRNTWLSIPPKSRPLPDRFNVVLSRNLAASMNKKDENMVKFTDSFEEALSLAFAHSENSHCFVIGGAKVYEQAIADKRCDRLYLTQIDAKFDCDVFFPSFDDKFSLLSETEVQEENGIPFRFKVYRRRLG